MTVEQHRHYNNLFNGLVTASVSVLQAGEHGLCTHRQHGP